MGGKRRRKVARRTFVPTNEAKSTDEQHDPVPSCSKQTTALQAPGPSASTSRKESPRRARKSIDELPCSPAEFQEVCDEVRGRLMYSGYYIYVRDFMDKRISQTGWRLHVMGKCREVVAQRDSNITHRTLLESVRDYGRETACWIAKEEGHDFMLRCYTELRGWQIPEKDKGEKMNM